MRSVLFAPHADDETLFASHLLRREQPQVVICFGSERDYGDTDVRTAESRAAVAILGGGPVEQWHGGDLVAQMRALDAAIAPTRVFAPAVPASHPHHVAVAEAAAEVFGARLVRYHTYDGVAKVRLGTCVPIVGAEAELKRQALQCYETQRTHPRAKVFYDEAVFELAEYFEMPQVSSEGDRESEDTPGADEALLVAAEPVPELPAAAPAPENEEVAAPAAPSRAGTKKGKTSGKAGKAEA